MKSRFLIVLLSVVFATLATAGAAYYIARIQAKITDGQKLEPVVVARKPAEPGATGAELFAGGSVAVVKIPKQYIASDAIPSLDEITDKVLAVGLSKGEQLTDGKFKKPTETGLAFRVPQGMTALSIAVDEVTGVGGRLKAGDEVNVFATFSPGADGQDVTKIMLQKIQVLEFSGSPQEEKSDGLLSAKGQPTGKKTVTLAVTPHQAEKIIYAAEKGHIWLSLRRANDAALPATSGQTVRTVLE